MPEAKTESTAFADSRVGGVGDYRNPVASTVEALADAYYDHRENNSSDTHAQSVAAVLDAAGFDRHPEYNEIKALCLAAYSDRLGTPHVASAAPATAVHTATPAVTLTGWGFEGASAVTFGADPATGVVVVSDTKITCTAPAQAGAGTFDITVTTPQGTTASGNGLWTAT